MRIIDCQQYSPEWWDARRGVPTASEFSSIITPTGKPAACDKYIHQLIADRFDGAYGLQEDYVSAAMANGTRMEPEARRFYEFERGVDVRQVGFCLTDCGRFGCSPDALVGEDGVLELKSPTMKTHIGYLLAGTLPAEYRPQVHGHLVVTGRAWCDFMSYCPGLPPLLVRVVPDDYTAAMREALEVFWPKYQAAIDRIESLRTPLVAGREVADPVFMA